MAPNKRFLLWQIYVGNGWWERWIYWWYKKEQYTQKMRLLKSFFFLTFTCYIWCMWSKYRTILTWQVPAIKLNRHWFWSKSYIYIYDSIKITKSVWDSRRTNKQTNNLILYSRYIWWYRSQRKNSKLIVIHVFWFC